MHRKILVIGLLFLLFRPVFGQGLKLGIFVDPVVSWIKADVDEIVREKARIGLDVGLTADYFFAENYAFSSGMSLFMTGGTLGYKNGIKLRTKDGEDGTVPAGGHVLYKVRYLKIPLGIKLKTHRIGRFVYYADLGMDPMIKITARADYASFSDVRIGKEIKNFNMGFHIGGGIKYPLGGNASAVFGLKYMNAFADMTVPPKDKVTINNLMFRIGISF